MAVASLLHLRPAFSISNAKIKQLFLHEHFLKHWPPHMLWVRTISHKDGCFADTFATLIPLYFYTFKRCFSQTSFNDSLTSLPIKWWWYLSNKVFRDFWTQSTPGVVTSKGLVWSVFHCFMISGIDWPLHKSDCQIYSTWYNDSCHP